MMEPWHVPLLAMAALAGPVGLYWAVRWLRDRLSVGASTPPDGLDEERTVLRRGTAVEQRRILVAAVLSAVLLVAFIAILGEPAANALTAAATAVSALIAAILAVVGLFRVQELRGRLRELEPVSAEQQTDATDPDEGARHARRDREV